MNYNALPWQNESTDSFDEIELSLGNDQKDEIFLIGQKHSTILFLTLKLDPLRMENYAQVNGSSSQFLVIISNNQ